MKYLLFIPFSLIIFAAISQAVIAQPELPDGFSWQHLEDVKATFLIPDEWHYSKQKEDETYAYFITQQELSKESTFSTGLSVNVIKKIQERSGITAEEFAQAHIYSLMQQDDIQVEHTWNGIQGSLHSFGIRYKSKDPSENTIVVHQLNVGNKETGTFYLIIFESLEESWDSSWPKGEKMMSIFSLNPSI